MPTVTYDTIVTGLQRAIVDAQTLAGQVITPPPPPPPVNGTPIGTYYPPNFTESGFGDAAGPPSCGVTARIGQQLKPPYPAFLPGFYLGDGDAPVRWTTINKPDWYDTAGTLYGSVPYAKTTVTAAPVHLTEFSVDLDATSLVKEFASKPNYGFVVAADSANSNTIKWRSSHASVNLPVLIVDGVTIQCERSTWFSTSSETSFAGNPEMRTAHNTDFALLRFDLRTIDVSKVQKATLRMWTFDQYGNVTIGLYRLWNPADPASVAPVQLGIAAQYPLDVGIETNSAVAFVQAVKDKNYSSLWGSSSTGDNSTFFTPADLAALGLPPMPGATGNAIAGVFKKGGPQSTLEAHWSPWRRGQGTTGPWETGQQLRPPAPMEEAYFRYYLMIHGNPEPDGGKLFGFDGRYRDWGTPPTPESLVGAGRGNSASFCDLLTGYSARGNHNAEPVAGSPCKGRIGVGMSDCYIPDQTGPYGPALTVDLNYLGQLKKDVPHCIEMHLKLNTVTHPEEKQQLITSITAVNGVATATLAQPCTSPLYVTGATMAVGGAGGYSSLAYNGEFKITVISPTQFTYPVPTTVAPVAALGSSPSYPLRFTCCLSTGNFDGILEWFINGRLAMRYSGMRFRGSAWLPDGKSKYGIDNFWFAFFQGGPNNPTEDYWMFASGIVIADKYIGPMVH
jgi:hypothetical protein